MGDGKNGVVGGDGTVFLALGDGCVQAAARRAHRELATALLEGRAEGSEAEAALETLARFLAETDFAALRARHPELAGGVARRVRLRASADGAIRWELEGPR